ncbi:MAG: SMP-30/gluconolactonase/LRE family protein [Phycisphaerae bacterium]|nr:SMP-30/gluconolactonase/LRE family protein [Phycisphaerae bacterium]
MAPLLFGIVGGLVLRSQAAGIDELIEADTLEQIATGFTFTEGPVWHSDGYLLFSDIPANTIYKWVPDRGVETFRSPSGHANGLIFDRQGRLIACEHSNRRVSRTEPDGTIVTLAHEYDGSRLNSPNDAVVKSDGSIYFTDPPFGLTAEFGVPGTQELPFEGVYRLSPDGETLELLEADIFPNGLAFSPDEEVLYVMAQQPGSIYAFDVQANGLLANRRVFADLSDWPDGMKVDIRGNLYATNNTLVVQVYDSEGTHLGDIVTPEPAANCGFGGDDNRTLFITAGTSVYRVQMKVQGALPAPADPEKARAVTPTPGTIVNLSEAGPLVWIAGETAVQHDVYFGTDFNDVNNADATDTMGIYRGRQDLVIYTFPEVPDLGQSYYWRIDEVNETDPNSPWKGDVWSFTTIDHAVVSVVDDFESYTDFDGHQIWRIWIDGYGDPKNGSQVGHLVPPYAETVIVYGGQQSMPMDYNNVSEPYYSEAKRTWETPQDYTIDDADTLTLYFGGEANNTPEPLYVAIGDNAGQIAAVVTHPDVDAVLANEWQKWHIALADLQAQGVDVGSVKKLIIGVGARNTLLPGGTGKIYIDDIRVTKRML